MDQDRLESPLVHRRTGVIVIILALVGVAFAVIGGYMVFGKRQSGGQTMLGATEVGPWCKLRQEWAREVEPLAGDIMLKSVKSTDNGELKKLKQRRNTLCQDYARRIREMRITHPVIKEVEIALVKEGKVRANIAVEIDNILTKLDVMDSTTLSEQKKKLADYIMRRIKQGRAQADREVDAALSRLGAQGCKGMFRGPMTDQGTTGNPYESWDEIEMGKTNAVKQFDERIKELEPVEQFTNRVYHELVRRYKSTLADCYAWAKKKRPSMSDKMGLRLRLDRIGKVVGLAIEWMENRDETILDCIEKKAAKWRLPEPVLEKGSKTQVVVVSLDFAKL